jgi:hypothetical protein
MIEREGLKKEEGEKRRRGSKRMLSGRKGMGDLVELGFRANGLVSSVV